MLRMMIVDDEKVIRETIRSLIDWQAMGIEIIGLCKNGIEAYDMILDEYPDIVLTDIKMPGLSGLDLIRRITQAGQQTEFIILSGYGDYEYTKVAMKYGIQHYLLKPCSVEEITEVVADAKKHCYRRRGREDEQKQDFLLLRKLHESVVFNLLTESMSEAPDYERLQRQYERFLSFTSVSYEACTLHPVAPENSEALYRTVHAFHDAQAPGIPLYGLQADDTLYLAFESYDYDYTGFDAFLQATAPGAQRRSFENMNALLPGVGKVVRKHRSMEMLTETQRVKLWNRKALYQIAENFVEILRTAQPEAHQQVVDALACRLAAVSDVEALRAVASNIFLSLPAGGTEWRLPLDAMSLLTELGRCEDAAELRAMTLEKLRALELRAATGGAFAEKIAALVREQIANPELSLKNIAENQLYMNVDYVSKKFMRSMGCKFSAFLARTRIETAMQMLAHDNGVSIAAVAEAVGCGNNPQYFSQLFKKHAGMTPTDYVKNIGGA